MKKDFCKGCNINSKLPSCAIGYVPNNIYIENIIHNDELKKSESFICHKNCQNFFNGKLSISSKCNECGLCHITCKNNLFENSDLLNINLEKVIFNDLSKLCILCQHIFPNLIVATEVQAKGNYRTKRIDLVIKKDSDIYLIKTLKELDKKDYYKRSYNEITTYYNSIFSNINFHILFLIPNSKVIDNIHINDFITLNTMVGGIKNGIIT